MKLEEIRTASQDEALWRERTLICLEQISWATKTLHDRLDALQGEVRDFRTLVRQLSESNHHNP